MSRTAASDHARQFTPPLPRTHDVRRGAVVTLSTDGDHSDALCWILPRLARASHSNRWTVWVAPPFRPRRALLRTIGFNLDHSRVVHPHRGRSFDTILIERALRFRANAFVLAWPGHCTSDDLSLLEVAARQGGTVGILFVRDQPPESRTIQPDQTDAPDQLSLGLARPAQRSTTVPIT